METTAIMTKVLEWEEAWAGYVDALEAYDASECWAGEDYVFHVARNDRNRKDAENRLRTIDADFCKRLEI